jgi:hypothetical protein
VTGNLGHFANIVENRQTKIRVAVRDEFELRVPISEQSDHNKNMGFSGAQKTNCRDRRRLNRRVGLPTFEEDLPLGRLCTGRCEERFG